MVCGCSFSAPSSVLPGTSYGELLAKRLDWDLVNLARQGCSNGGIRLQIDEVIRQRPDFAIIAPTFFDRMEIPASAAPYEFRSDDYKGPGCDLQKHLQNTELKNGYDPADGIKNVNYNNQPYNMICETIFSLAENYQHQYRSRQIDKDTNLAIKMYINHIYDSAWKKQLDEWIIIEGVMQAYFAGIKFFMIPSNLWMIMSEARKKIPAVVPNRYIMQNQEHSPLHAAYLYPPKGEDLGYHTEPEGQEYLADIYYKLITEWET